MTRALQMACGHKVSILSAVIDAERETSLCFQPYDATIRAAWALHSVLSPSQEPALVPFACSPLKVRNLSHIYFDFSSVSTKEVTETTHCLLSSRAKISEVPPS